MGSCASNEATETEAPPTTTNGSNHESPSLPNEGQPQVKNDPPVPPEKIEVSACSAENFVSFWGMYEV
jgi:hypothetical protein